MATTIYIRLLNEGTDVFRPTSALHLGEEVYKIMPSLNYDPTDENWEFVPGTIVRCEKKELEGDEVLVAVARKDN